MRPASAMSAVATPRSAARAGSGTITSSGRSKEAEEEMLPRPGIECRSRPTACPAPAGGAGRVRADPQFRPQQGGRGGDAAQAGYRIKVALQRLRRLEQARGV